MRVELQAALDLAETLPVSELPELLGQLEQVRLTAYTRIVTPAPAPSDRLLDVNELADRLHVSKDFIYRNKDKYKSFGRRQGNKWLWSSSGLDAFLKRAR
jgi:hypothetical protein